jgi:hypothetical protein
MISSELQKLFFQLIKAKLPAHISFVEAIAEVLDISIDSAYRRIRSEKQITFEETQRLCGHFHLSLDQLMNIDSNSMVFFGNNVLRDTFGFDLYIDDILLNIKRINAASRKKMYYEAKETPIFYYFYFPELATFKCFFWMKTVLCYPHLNNMRFEDYEFNADVVAAGREILKIYNGIPSTEIWSYQSINVTLQQIEYYRYSGIFRSKETVDRLYDQFEQLIDHIAAQAECGEKFFLGKRPVGDNENYQLYLNELFFGHNSIFVETDGISTAFVNHNTINFMATNDKSFCDYYRQCLDNTIKKSSLISNTNEKERSRFFNVLKNKIARSRNALAIDHS